ncbi:MAG: hypothetical protein U5K54_24865 [Cytophagales bacterium]|nr:hypothetical protein [Cytophagales bacterium]
MTTEEGSGGKGTERERGKGGTQKPGRRKEKKPNPTEQGGRGGRGKRYDMREPEREPVPGRDQFSNKCFSSEHHDYSQSYQSGNELHDLTSGTSVVTVNPIPATPTINPVGPLTVCEGTAAIVLTSSAGAGNQWYKDGAPIGGATLATLNITTIPANSGNYTVISTVSGCASLVSTAVAGSRSTPDTVNNTNRYCQRHQRFAVGIQ